MAADDAARFEELPSIDGGEDALFFEASPSGLVVADATGRIVRANRAARALLGEGWSDRPLGAFVTASERDAFDRWLASAAPEVPMDVSLAERGDRAHPTLVEARCLARSNGRTCVSIEDVTEPRRLDLELRQAQKMEMLGQLASGISHDFNNLLMGLVGCAEVAISKLDAKSIAAARAAIVDLRDAAKRGASLTDRLLAFSRKRAREPASVDLDEAIALAEPMLEVLVGEGIRIELSLESRGAVIGCERAELEQLLMNLVANARDAMPEGGRLRVTTRRIDGAKEHEAAPRDVAVIEVSDEGVGIDEASLARVFEPFFTTKARGNGLGLATVLAIVERCHGTIEAVSQPGSGTKFTLRFPILTASPEEPAAPPSDGRGSGVVLVVEDDDLVRRAIKSQLEARGYEVLSAPNGDEALALVSGRAPAVDAILCDVRLPGKGGRDVVRAVRQLATRARVLYMSAQPRERLLVEGRIDPEHPLLQKPFGADEFQRALALLTPPRKAKQGGVVLLVEDDPLMRSALRVLLETWEYRVLDAGTVGEAARITEAAGAPPVAAVVTDLLLPDGTGDVLVRRLRARPDAGATPAIYLTGFGAGDAVLENAQARAPGVLLQKPFDAQTLRDHLEEVLEEAR